MGLTSHGVEKTGDEAAGKSIASTRGMALAAKAASYAKRGQYAKAAKAYAKAHKYADGNQAHAAMLLGQADCEFETKHYHAAYLTYKKALESYPMQVSYDHVLARLRGLAEHFVRGEGVFLGIPNLSLAIEVYELIRDNAKAGSNAAADALRLARLQNQAGEKEEAIVTYRDLAKRYPMAPESADARLDLGRLYLDLGKGGDGDGRLVRQARSQLKNFRKSAPGHPRMDEADLLLSIANERQAEAKYQLGLFYLRKVHRRLPAARRYLYDVVRTYPSTTSAMLAKLVLGQIETSATLEEPLTALVRSSATMKMPAVSEVPVESMTPEKIQVHKPLKPLHIREGVQKWLLPLEDLELDTGEKKDE